MTDPQSTPRQTRPRWQSVECRQRLAGFAFRIYKSLLSPMLHAVAPSRCLYLPTCSEYAYTAISRFGMARGTWMAMRRFARCHPWGKGGLDPVPDRLTGEQTRSAEAESSVLCDNRTDHLP